MTATIERAVTRKRLQLTRRFLALEIADQLDDLVHVVEALQLPLVVNDLHGILNHLEFA